MRVVVIVVGLESNMKGVEMKTIPAMGGGEGRGYFWVFRFGFGFGSGGYKYKLVAR